MENTYFVFREAQSIRELKALLQLRYRVYRRSRLKNFVEENECGIDLDCYDLRAHHFGLFMHYKNGVQPVGYHRPVRDGYGSMQREVLQLAEEIPGMLQKVKQAPAEPFPIMTYWPHPSVIRDFYETLQRKGESLGEATIFPIDPGISSLAIAKFVIESEIAVQLFCGRFDHGIMVCTPLHARFYRRYGFQRLNGTTNSDINGLPATCVTISVSSVPPEVRNRITQMASAFKKSGQICYLPSEPDHFYAPLKFGPKRIAFRRAA